MREEFVFGKRSYLSLSKQFNLSIPTIQKYLDDFINHKTPGKKTKQSSKEKAINNQEKIVIVIDTVYLSSRSFALMVAKEAETEKTIERMYLISETISSFVSLIESIKNKGINIVALVVDGRRGFLKAFYPQIPTQMCQFHQIQIINRHLTTRPKLNASIGLRKIALTLPNINKILFTKLLNHWYLKWAFFLKEKTKDEEAGRWFYTHKRLRSAYHSLKTNLDYLFVFKEKRYRHLNIPNTTNLLDGFFSHLKDSLRVHRGLKRKRKIKIIESILWKKS